MGKFVSIDAMEKENAPPSSRLKLSLSLKRRFAGIKYVYILAIDSI